MRFEEVILCVCDTLYSLTKYGDLSKIICRRTFMKVDGTGMVCVARFDEMDWYTEHEDFVLGNVQLALGQSESVMKL